MCGSLLRHRLALVHAALRGIFAIAVAALLHELLTLPKNHPDSSRAGDVCARERARAHGARARPACDDRRRGGGDPGSCLLERRGSCRAGEPGSSGTDRLDALGAIGLARMWATCADRKRPFYSPSDPFCATRTPDDKEWGSTTSTRSSSRFRRAFTRRRRVAWPKTVSRSCTSTSYVAQLRSELASVA